MKNCLGVIRSLNNKKVLQVAYHTETRPYNQGSRLTAYELVHDEIPSCLIADSMVAALMKEKKITGWNSFFLNSFKPMSWSKH